MAAMYTPTAWGYSVATEDGKLPPIITPEQLEESTGGRFGADTPGVGTVLEGVSAVIRDACGWHVSPVLDVEERTGGPGKVIALRTLMMPEDPEVVEMGEELGPGQFEWDQRGLIKRACFRCWPEGWGSVVARYRSGIPPEMAPALVAVAAQVASNALAAPAGVQSEQAGNVSISYNQTASGVSGGVRLLDSDLAMLRVYMLGEVLS
ncbi:MAG: hypothetical protein U0M51_02105 [Eggerthellaceae bacterium]